MEIIILVIVGIILVRLYMIGHRTRINLQSFIIMLLLDKTIYEKQNAGLIDLVQSIDEDHPPALAKRVNRSIENFANDLGQKGSIGAALNLVWELKHPE